MPIKLMIQDLNNITNSASLTKHTLQLNCLDQKILVGDASSCIKLTFLKNTNSDHIWQILLYFFFSLKQFYCGLQCCLQAFLYCFSFGKLKLLCLFLYTFSLCACFFFFCHLFWKYFLLLHIILFNVHIDFFF